MTFAPDARTQIQTLVEMLSYQRPHNSWSEQLFISTFISPLGPSSDSFGNLIVEVGEKPTTLFSCHTDTVHHKAGKQLVCVKDGYATVAKKKGNNCLGADDGVGCWIMIEMIKAQRPGLYIFHRDEEHGGNGSSHIAKNTPWMLDGIAHAIAFDRKGYSSVITHQAHGRCCSDQFGKELAELLGLNYDLDDTGLFTDTANYTDLVGECTNVSVGYHREHGPTESLNLDFAQQLLDVLLHADFSTLGQYREPGEIDPNDDWGGDWFKKYQSNASDGPSVHMDPMTKFVFHNYRAVADFLQQMGVTTDDLEDYKDDHA